MVGEGEEAGNGLIAISNASSPCWLTLSRRGLIPQLIFQTDDILNFHQADGNIIRLGVEICQSYPTHCHTIYGVAPGIYVSFPSTFCVQSQRSHIVVELRHYDSSLTFLKRSLQPK